MYINPNWTYKILPKLPKPPVWLISQIDRTYRPGSAQFSPDSREYLSIRKKADWKKQTYDWIQPMASNSNVRHYFSSDAIDWINKNITHEFQATNSGAMFFDEPQLPHTDVTRDFVLLYNLETGGPDSELCFWQEAGKSRTRERMLAVEHGAHLQLIDRIKGPFDSWYMVNARIIHSVENISTLRLNLQVSFDTALPQAFCKQHLT
ncbi:MAG: hypothetical protein GXP19_10100 [Gammaproteobacteria bacterium]|nr:hypothetical protein [Gammaproteobacteria bacterium]